MIKKAILISGLTLSVSLAMDQSDRQGEEQKPQLPLIKSLNLSKVGSYHEDERTSRDNQAMTVRTLKKELQQAALRDWEEIDLSENFFTYEGAQECLALLANSQALLPNLRVINLRNNNIRIHKGSKGYDEFIQSVIRVLSIPRVEKIILSARGSNYDEMFLNVKRAIPDSDMRRKLLIEGVK